MGSNKSKKSQLLLCLILTIVGLVVACGNFIPNDYIKFGVTLVCLCIGIFGTFSALGQSGNTNEETK